MRAIKTTTTLIVLLFGGSAKTETLHVPGEYPTISLAIEASQNGDTVLVAPGRYEENVDIQGKQITLTSSHGPYETFILGHIVIAGFADTTGCTIQGFTQIGQDRDPFAGKPGIKIYSGKPIIIGNILRDNIFNSLGGGISVYQSSAIANHNIIENNWGVGFGGGLYIEAIYETEVSHNLIRNNMTGYGFPWHGMGGGIAADGANIYRNLIYNNVSWAINSPDGAGKGGGAVLYGTQSRPTTYFYNNTVVKNYAHGGGGIEDGAGVFVWVNPNGNVILENNIIAFNYEGGGLYYCPWSAAPMIERYNLFFGNQDFNIIAPETSITDIFADPMFVDTALDDYHLLPGSPCIDAGNPDSPLDPDSTRVDIGALFFDQTTAIDEKTESSPYKFELFQNYPNPFNGQTNISYYLQKSSNVSLTIFDITGAIVSRLVNNEHQLSGEHKYVWQGLDINGNPVSTAIYFYQLEVDGSKIVKSMILLK
ncbi:MAG: T9SS type A sorting domain-containing protein [Candidatus Zixiibacteriota bacterium]|nr:MAG: T9SS type A sorting domain-containing protein [candidate division Zixibacteria bacterium]